MLGSSLFNIMGNYVFFAAIFQYGHKPKFIWLDHRFISALFGASFVVSTIHDHIREKLVVNELTFAPGLGMIAHLLQPNLGNDHLYFAAGCARIGRQGASPTGP